MICKKLIAAVIVVAMISPYAVSYAQNISAEETLFPETLTVEGLIGDFERSFSLDIDGDNKKEEIGYYYFGDPYDIGKPSGDSDCYTPLYECFYVFDGDSEPVILYEMFSDYHNETYLHIIKDDNTGEVFLGFFLMSIFDAHGLYKLSLDGQYEEVIFCDCYPDDKEMEEYNAYTANVTYLEDVTYGKGDVDGDADITISDATAMLSYYAENAAGLQAEINDIQENAADMDKDGEITLNDATTALSLYAEHAAGIIDTPILPSSVHFDGVNQYDGYYSLTTGDLESVFYLDIDNDGVKESIGRYINTNLENTYGMHCAPYVYQVYDNGRFVDTYGLNTGIYRTQFVLISDHNINETYIACLTEGGIASSFHFAVIDREYPKLSDVMYYDFDYYFDGHFVEEGNETFRMGNDLTDVDRAEFLEYISNLEIIDPYGDVAEDLYLFKYHRFLT